MAEPAALQHPGVDVERDEPAQRSAVAQRVEQHASLLRSAAAELDQRVGARRGGDLRRPRAQDLRLGAGRVVLGQPGDLVEQVAAHRVVEPLGRQRLRRLGQPVAHIAAQRLRGRVGGQVVGQREGHDDPFSGIKFDARVRRPSTRWRSGISCQPGSSSYGSLASTTPSSRRSTDRVSPHVVARSSRSVGRQDVQPCVGVGGGDLDDGVAERVETALEDQRGQQCAVDWSTPPPTTAGSTARSTRPLCDSSHRPSVNGADADGFDRHADTGRPHRRDNATAAQRGRHRGERRVTPQRRGAAPPAGASSARQSRRSRRPSRRRSSGRASAGAAHTTAPAARTAARAPATRPIRGSPSQPRWRHIRRPRPGAHPRRSAAGSGGPSCGSSAAGCSPRPPTSRRAAPCSRQPQTSKNGCEYCS